MARTPAPTSAPTSAAANAANPTEPDNTPVPGGGSWRWDAANAGWVAAAEPAEPAAPAPESSLASE